MLSRFVGPTYCAMSLLLATGCARAPWVDSGIIGALRTNALLEAAADGAAIQIEGNGEGFEQSPDRISLERMIRVRIDNLTHDRYLQILLANLETLIKNRSAEKAGGGMGHNGNLASVRCDYIWHDNAGIIRVATWTEGESLAIYLVAYEHQR